MLDVQERRAGHLYVLALSGKLDSASCDEFGERLLALVHAGEHRLALDLRSLVYVNSMGLRALGRAAQELAPLDGCLALVGARGPVAEVLAISGFAGLLPSFPSLEDAERSIR